MGVTSYPPENPTAPAASTATESAIPSVTSISSSFATLAASLQSNQTINASTPSKPTQTTLEGTLYQSAACDLWPATQTYTDASSQTLKPVVDSQKRPFSLAALSELNTALSAANLPLPTIDPAAWGFKGAEAPPLHLIRTAKSNKVLDKCIAHLIHRTSDIRVSLCLPYFIKNLGEAELEGYINKIFESFPLEGIMRTLRGIESDIKEFQAHPSEINGTICRWEAPDVEGTPNSIDLNQSGIQVYNLGWYNNTNAVVRPEGDSNYLLTDPWYAWYLQISSGARQFEDAQGEWGVVTAYSPDLKWDLIKTKFNPNDTVSQGECAEPGGNNNAVKIWEKFSQAQLQEHIYPAINQTIHSLKAFAEDIYVSQFNDRIERILDEKDGDCLRRFCLRRENLTVSLCGFKSFFELQELDSESQYAGALSSRQRISEVVNFLRVGLENAFSNHYNSPEMPDNSHFGVPLRNLMCAFGSSPNNNTYALPGTFDMYLGRRNGRKLTECKNYDGQNNKKICGQFRLEISTKPCTILRGSCAAIARTGKPSNNTDGVSVESIENARDEIEKGAIARKFAQNLVGETPESWKRLTQGPDGQSYDQFFCDYTNNVKVAVTTLDKEAQGVSGVDYDVPTKDLVRGINLLVQEFKQVGDENEARVSSGLWGCSWTGTGKPSIVGQGITSQTTFDNYLYYGRVTAQEYAAANGSPFGSSWPWAINVTRLYDDDPCNQFAAAAYS
ncbi:hypothetical protein TWF481_000040 [Arthrobotrys musiformis]|uniref:Uncharacterized protein n=1 Tax=Arthrobotrys musiformis TaxID=47236 RepID=A0AAV9WLT5_9PEZI